jgi:DNA-binding NtrC family response regulator
MREKSTRILVLDDESVIRDICRRLLQREGLSCDLAANVSQAEDLLKKSQSYSLLITDLRLPDGNGIDFIQQFKQRQPGAKVMVVTGSPLLLTQVPEETKKDWQCLTKPFDMHEFVQAVRKLSVRN